MSTKKEREWVLELLSWSPQSRQSLVVPAYPDMSLSGALDDLVTDDVVEEYEDGVDSAGRPVLMYRAKRDD